MQPRIIYTYTDEAPMLATHSFLPIVEAFSRAADIDLKTWDISLAGRILATFNDYLPDGQKFFDALSELGRMVKEPDANVIKLPNISASTPQIQQAIKELQEKGYPLPDFPEEPQTDAEKKVRSLYDKVKGSAVNPVIREGNSDRRPPASVKAYARKHPHSMGQWTADSRTHVASMDSGDFYGSEKSLTLDKNSGFSIHFLGDDGSTKLLRNRKDLQKGEILDAAVMNSAKLRKFLADQMDQAKSQDVLFSLHLKATMMKVSDPVIFGHAVSVFFDRCFEQHGDLFKRLSISADNGLKDLETRLASLDSKERDRVEKSIGECMARRPKLAMVNSDKGISNLHVPSDVIIDASMPAAIRMGGKMWGPDGQAYDMKAVIPDRSYAGVYQAVIDFCKEHGAFDPATMGSVSNVGLMAQKAEEYGSHDKTFTAPGNGVIQAIADDGAVLLEQRVEQGDIFRMCQLKDEPVSDWVQLALRRARASKTPIVFWLDENRAHDAQVIAKVNACLSSENTDDVEIKVLPPVDACRHALEYIKAGKDVIAVTGNVLRDYLTDLFPILELGTSAKMLSIVPLMNGGGLFETGAGGSAPKHIQQLIAENHLRWDSLGEFLALAASYEHLANTFSNPKAGILGQTLDNATAMFLDNGKSPSRKCGQLDNRGSHFYLALYWAQCLAKEDDAQIKAVFEPVARDLQMNEQTIVAALLDVQGQPVDIGGYYKPDKTKTDAVMRPCQVFNRVIDGMN